MIKLSDHFNYWRLIRFTSPSIGMMVVLSIYSVVDGFFVSNFVGTLPFAALNFIVPLLTLLSLLGFLFGTGGGALIAKTIGEGDRVKANQIFSMLVYLSIGLGILLEIFGIMYVGNFAELLGARGIFLEQSILYGRIVLLALPFNILQFEFQSLTSTAEKPKLGFYVSLAAGITNILLDALFIVVFDWGLKGAAAATAISQTLGGIVPLIYFSRENSSLLRLTKTKFDGGALWQTCTNGASELLSGVSTSIVGMLDNRQLLNYAGENGVATFGILIYVTYIFEAVLVGYSVGAAPIVSYHFGAKNHSELKNLLRKSFVIIGALSVVMFICTEALARPASKIFVGSDENLLEMTVHAFQIFAFTFLFAGFTIFTSSFFTALNNGIISALISGLRTLVFEVCAVILLPLIFGLNGIWFSIVGADIMALILSAAMLIINRRRYNY